MRPLSGAAANEAIFVFSNQQPATNLWYHDHAMGITRLNVYAGLAGYISCAISMTLAYQILQRRDLTFLRVTTKSACSSGQAVQCRWHPFLSDHGITAVHPIWMPEFFVILR